ncbi:MAG: formate dehydrogenase accessory sulfurtransferase FdhD [Syntrophales bacterium]
MIANMVQDNLSKALRIFPVTRFDGIRFETSEVPLAREVALRIIYNRDQVMTVACVGNHLDELAVGFLRSEGFLRSFLDIESLTVREDEASVEVLTVDHRRVKTGMGRDCGTLFSSGARGIGSEDKGEEKYLGSLSMRLDPKKILHWMEELVGRSVLHNASHGTHCSALVDRKGILICREDIGRHNTIDMIGGYALLHDMDCSDKILMTTGRISSEMVNKIRHLGIPILVSRSAPTTEAIRILEEVGITLVAYVRGGKMNIYTHKDRIILGL